MSFWDDIKNFTKPYGAEEDYDDYDDEEMEDGYEEEETTSRFGRRERKAPAAAPVSEPSFTSSVNSATSVFTPVTSTAASSASAAPVASTGFSGTVINTGASNKQQVILTRPETFNDATTIATNLRAKKAVVLNLEGVNKDLACRMVDFLSGAIYCLDGSVTKIAQATYLFCPFNMEVLGDLNSLQSDIENYV